MINNSKNNDKKKKDRNQNRGTEKTKIKICMFGRKVKVKR